jgi:hypothetical protein
MDAFTSIISYTQQQLKVNIIFFTGKVIQMLAANHFCMDKKIDLETGKIVIK